MNHYSNNEWFDYVCGVTPAEDRSQLRRHLESACVKYKKLEGIWRTVQKLAQKEISYRPPDSAFRFVKGQIVVTSPSWKPSPVANLAQQIFDSFRQPLPAGVRSIKGSPRHLVYRSGTILVDVRLEAAPQGSPAYLAGQVLDLASPSCAMKDISVSVQIGEKDIASTATDQFGEFHLELDSMDDSAFHLAVWIEPSGPIFIPLPTPNSGGRPS
jgi:hypothetical protein